MLACSFSDSSIIFANEQYFIYFDTQEMQEWLAISRSAEHWGNFIEKRLSSPFSPLFRKPLRD